MSHNTSDDAKQLHGLEAEIEHLTQELAHLSTAVHYPDDFPSVFEQRKALQTQLHDAQQALDAYVGISGNDPRPLTRDTES